MFIEGVNTPDQTHSSSVHTHVLDDPLVYGWVGLFWTVCFLLEGNAARADEWWRDQVCPNLGLSGAASPPAAKLVDHIKRLWATVPRPIHWGGGVPTEYQRSIDKFCSLAQREIAKSKPSHEPCLKLLEETINQDLRNRLWFETVETIRGRGQSPHPCILLVGNEHVNPLWQLWRSVEDLKLKETRVVFKRSVST